MSVAQRFPPELGYAGLKMTADEFLALGETAERYELIDGVVVMSPSATPNHNELLLEIALQLRAFADRTRLARVFIETDVRFPAQRVYCPDISIYRADRLPPKVERLDQPPDLVVEVLPPGSKALDLITKREDYDAAGVMEYWTADPTTGEVRCWCRPSAAPGSKFFPVDVSGDALNSAAFPGFTLDLVPLRRIANPGR